MRRALTAACLAAAVAVGAAACGSEEEQGQDAAETRYAAAVDRFCREVSRAVTDVQADLATAQKSAGTDVDAAAEAVGGALTGFASDVDASLGRLRKAEVPSEYRGFHDGATSGLGRVVTALRDAGTRAEQGDVRALSQLGSSLEDIRVPEPPPELSERAPACRDLQRTTGTGTAPESG